MSIQQDSSASITTFWSIVDKRINAAIRDFMRQQLGTPRPRAMSINIPLADTVSTPAVGWLQSIVIFHTSRLVGWEINAIVPGSITVDIRVSTIPSSPSTQPTLTSCPGVGNFPSLTGYAVAGRDLSKWAIQDIQAGSVLHIYVISASAIKQAILGLQIIDLVGKTLQV